MIRLSWIKLKISYILPRKSMMGVNKHFSHFYLKISKVFCVLFWFESIIAPIIELFIWMTFYRSSTYIPNFRATWFACYSEKGEVSQWFQIGFFCQHYSSCTTNPRKWMNEKFGTYPTVDLCKREAELRTDPRHTHIHCTKLRLIWVRGSALREFSASTEHLFYGHTHTQINGSRRAAEGLSLKNHSF